MPNRIKVHGALLIAGLIYGANFVVAKTVMPDHLKPFGFIVIRVFFASLLFWIFHGLFIKEKFDLKTDFRRLLLVAICGVGFNMLAFFKGLNFTSPVNASVIMTLVPLIVLISSYFLLNEPITKSKIIGILIGATGAILLITSQGVSLSNTGLVGDLLILVNGTFYGLYLVLVKPLMSKYHAATVVKWAFTLGFFIVLPFGIPDIVNIHWYSIPWPIWLSIIYVIVGTTFSTYLLTAWALKYVNSTTASAYIYIQPVFATFIAIAFTGEHVSIEKLLYTALVFSGVYLVSNK